MYKHILIATDGSELAQKAETTGLALAKALNAKVTAVTVTETWMPFRWRRWPNEACQIRSRTTRNAWRHRQAASFGGSARSAKKVQIASLIR